MPQIPVLEVMSFSDSQSSHSVENFFSGKGKWTTSKGNKSITLEAEIKIPPSVLDGINVGNCGSASVEIEVGRSGEGTTKREKLLYSKVLMSRQESTGGNKGASMHFFKKEDLAEKARDKEWDRMRIVCHQPFNREIFGLSVFNLTGTRKDDDKAEQKQPTKTKRPELLDTSGAERLIDRVLAQGPKKPANNSSLNPLLRCQLFKKRAREYFEFMDPLQERSASELRDWWYEAHPEKLGMDERRDLELILKSHTNVRGSETRTSGEDEDLAPIVNLSTGKRNRVAVMDSSLSETPSKKSKKSKRKESGGKEEKEEGRKYLGMNEEELANERILHQTHIYPKDRYLPVKGGSPLLVKKQTEVKFIKDGHSVYMAYKNSVYVPDVKPEQVKKLFKKYTEEEITSGIAPKEVPESSSVDQCPLCNARFLTQEALIEHCSTCQGSGPSSPGPSRCPICNEEQERDELEEHAKECAEKAFGSGPSSSSASNGNPIVIMSDSEGDDSDVDVPPTSVCKERIDTFVAVTNTDEAYAQMVLQQNKWELDAAINKHMESEVRGRVVPAKASSLGLTMSTKAPERFSLLSWNIDGLDAKNLNPRTKEVCRLIEAAKVDVVFLQEVVAASLSVIKKDLGAYEVLVPGPETRGDYFTAVLLRRFSVKLDAHVTKSFKERTVMGRNLMMVQCHIGKAKMCLLNTHLESTKEHAENRTWQLRKCFGKASKQDDCKTVIFGGDLNSRDKELSSIGGAPEGMNDLWEKTGARKECQYTWDMTRNTNLEFPGRFKPRCRFDRLYLRDSSPRQVKVEHFGLFGIEKVPHTQSFPSDHWGILAGFTVDSN